MHGLVTLFESKDRMEKKNTARLKNIEEENNCTAFEVPLLEHDSNADEDELSEINPVDGPVTEHLII